MVQAFWVHKAAAGPEGGVAEAEPAGVSAAGSASSSGFDIKECMGSTMTILEITGGVQAPWATEAAGEGEGGGAGVAAPKLSQQACQQRALPAHAMQPCWLLQSRSATLPLAIGSCATTLSGARASL